jgi:hypothetical protein
MRQPDPFLDALLRPSPKQDDEDDPFLKALLADSTRSAAPALDTAPRVQPRGAAPAESTRTPVATPRQQPTIKGRADYTAGQEAVEMARSLGRGLTMGISPRIEAVARGVPVAQVREEMGAYREASPGLSMGSELVGGMLTGGAGLIRSAGAAGMRAIVPRVLGSAIGQGAISGAAESEGGVGEAAKDAALYGAIGGIAPKALGLVGRIPVIKQIGEGVGGAASRAYQGATRAAADLLEGTPMQRLGRAIEPMDVQRAQRIAGERVPGATTGPTVRQMVPEAGGPREAVRTARATEQQARGELTSVQRALLQAQQAEDAAKLAVEQSRQQAQLGATTLSAQQLEELTRTQQRAAQRQAVSGPRAERLRETAAELRGTAKQREAALGAELTAATRQTREQAKAAAQSALEEARAEAAQTVSQLAGRQARGTAVELQETIRKQQLAKGDASYDLVRRVGPPPEVDPALYREVSDDPVLRSAFNEAQRIVKRERSRPEALQQGLAPLRMVQINGREVPELDVYTFDVMRRIIRERARPTQQNVVGLTASQRRESLNQIQRVEDRFLAGYGSDETGNLVRAARAEYRAEFAKLEALRDGLNMGSVKAGKPSGLLKPNPKELDAVLDRVKGMSDAEREAFQVGAQEWFGRLVMEAPDDALKFAQRFTSPAAQERLALALGDDAVQQIRALAPTAVGARQATAARQVREEAQGMIEGLQQRKATEPASLFERAERARALAGRAGERAQSAKEAVPALKQTQAQQRMQFRTEAAQSQLPLAQQAVAATGERQAARQATRQTQGAVAEATAARGDAQRALREAIAEGGDLRTALGGALRSPERAADATRLLGSAAEPVRAQSREVLGSMVQRQVQSLASAGNTPQEITEMLMRSAQNPAVRALMAQEIDDALRAITRPTVGAVFPRSIAPSFGGFAARGLMGGQSR